MRCAMATRRFGDTTICLARRRNKIQPLVDFRLVLKWHKMHKDMHFEIFKILKYATPLPGFFFIGRQTSLLHPTPHRDYPTPESIASGLGLKKVKVKDAVYSYWSVGGVLRFFF